MNKQISLNKPDLDTTHHLLFEVAPWLTNEFMLFRIGTCEGLWCGNDKSYSILAINNRKPHNGHLDDVLEWFEYSAKRDKKELFILEVWNKRFYNHLIEKRGFQVYDSSTLIKTF